MGKPTPRHKCTITKLICQSTRCLWTNYYNRQDKTMNNNPSNKLPYLDRCNSVIFIAFYMQISKISFNKPNSTLPD